MQGDAAAWGLAWQQLDDEALPPLLEALEAGRAVYLTLAGERSAAAFGPPSGGGQGDVISRDAALDGRCWGVAAGPRGGGRSPPGAGRPGVRGAAPRVFGRVLRSGSRLELYR